VGYRPRLGVELELRMLLKPEDPTAAAPPLMALIYPRKRTDKR
jgi:hypothetical protein